MRTLLNDIGLRFPPLLLILFLSLTNASGQHIEFIIFQCKGCDLHLPKADRSQLEQIIAKESAVEMAANQIKDYFRTEMGDRFMLNCEGCKGRKTYIYPPPATMIPPAGRKGLGTLGMKGRGADEQLYSFNEVIRLLQDTLLIFDSLTLDLSKLANRNDEVLSSFAIGYVFNGRQIKRPLGYNEKEKAITLSYKNFFGNVLTRNVTDSIHVAAFYYNNGSEVSISDNFNYLFATPAEKKEIKELFAYYKQQFPSWTIDQIADELIFIIEQRYKNVNKSNFMKWLKAIN